MATNPLLAAFDNLDPVLKQNIMAAHARAMNPATVPNPMQGTQPPQLGALRQPPGPPTPEPTQTIPPIGGGPTVPPIASAAPSVRGPTPIDVEQQKLAEMRAKPAAFENVYNKVTQSGFGQAHPTAGKVLGTLGQVGSTIGDVALSGLFPGVGAFVPGTTARRGVQIGAATGALDTDVANAQKQAEMQLQQAQAAEVPTRTALEQAQAAHYPEQMQLQRAQVNAQLAEHGLQMDETGKISPMTVEQLSPIQKAQLNPWAKEAGNQPLGDRVPQLNDAMLQRYQVNHPEAKELPASLSLRPDATKADFERIDKLLQAEESASATKTQRDQLEQMRLQTLALAQQRFERGGEKQDTTLKTQLLKTYQPSLDSAERFNVMTDSYEKAIKNHDQQAMLNLLANHLGMTMGLQKGAKINQAVINEAQKSQPLLQGIVAHFGPDGYATGVALSPQQMRSMVDLGQQRYREDTVKARNEGRYLGDTGDGPDRTPSKATINFYMGQANGDPAKAKQLAADDGWTVK